MLKPTKRMVYCENEKTWKAYTVLTDARKSDKHYIDFRENYFKACISFNVWNEIFDHNELHLAIQYVEHWVKTQTQRSRDTLSGYAI